MPSYGVCARQIYYGVLAESEDGLTLDEVAERVHARCVELGARPFRPANAKRVMSGLVKDGLVSRASLAPSAPGLPGRGPRTRYRALEAPEDLLEVLVRPQTTRVVSEVWGRRTVGDSAPSQERSSVPSRLYFKVPGYVIEPTPRRRVNRLVEDGSWENKAINWIADNGTPIRKWRWKDQRALEAETARRLRSSASQA